MAESDCLLGVRTVR